ncbi:MAG: DUF465 domain-containing protein [Rhodobiaceae bacterium]|nr:DUF465 domain-containing protein [Rhodobiaceae bacterium]
MQFEAHLVELQRKHRTLDQLIEEEMAHPGADDLRIGELKRKKLRIKEEIAKLDGMLH